MDADTKLKDEPLHDACTDEEPPWEDAYARHFTLVLSTILFEREDFRGLLCSEEIAIGSRFLTALKPFEQQLYARLLQRQGPWYRITSLFRYFVQDEQHPINEQVQDVVHVMIDAGFLQHFPITSSAKSIAQQSPSQELATLETALDAIERCATAPELAALYKKMTGSRKHIAKAELMTAIKKVVKTQRRIDGSRIPAAQLMQQIWLESYPLTGRKSSDVMALRMTPAARDLMLRLHRLFYFVSTPPFNAMSLMPPQLEDEARLVALAAHKLRQEPTQWPGLMVFFKKVAYPEYTLSKCSSGDDESTAEVLNSHRVFPSSEAYVSYEVAYQLHRIMNVVDQCIRIMTPEKEYQEPDLELKWMLSDAPPVFLAFQRLLFILYDDEESTETEDECVVVAPPGKTEDEASANWQMRSWNQFYGEIEKMQSLDDLVLASRGCLQAYLKWMKAAAYTTSGIPVFFSKCNAGYHLVRILHTAVGLYEKMRKYQIATLLLNELLTAPFLERKRGYWWDRLALNLEHLKCADQARDTRLNRLNRRKERDERIRVESLSTADLLLQSTGTSLIAPIMDNEDDEEKAVPAEAHVSYEYRKNHIVGRPLNRQTGEKSRFVGFDDEPCTVEQLVLQYYRDHHRVDEISVENARFGGWYGVHSEGMVFGNLFGILMWDVLYASIPDVFQTPFQSAPLDFGYADVFYESRRDLIERRLAQVKSDWTMEELLTTFVTRWNSEFGKLANLLRYMATSKEFHQAQNGLPDLLLLRIELSKPKNDPVSPTPQLAIDSHGCLNIHAFCGMDEELNMNEKTQLYTKSLEEEDSQMTISEAKLEEQPLQHVLDLLKDDSYVAHLKLVEVKGPRDRLSDKQLLWLEVLSEEIGLDTSVMHVEEPEKHAKRKIKERATTAKSAPTKRQNKRRKCFIECFIACRNVHQLR
ncbi:hypothetical protein PC116_g14631 [Phytophthora cactorum]|uniref:Fanconi-associated nuclease n=1 Tax=Phytophthora cactorum TaxID=29920 RepID=A0A8T1DE43_9STRA|nr:hypothetical protein PC112_g10829 [Phytophthora cactorum]KAG2856790.1 hypothetical protein PC113_g11272 [Phytophthora cactorum]KAG2904703.1 hypothetical protein PC114_g11793 [Phytophthora cactorum]KAG2919786.1 hypothetical protein PC115_g10025 [Phytophthora cactorum]KAG2938111.1 hypothetical protein PC117_g11411 [Phytophthora cactorum]